MRFGADSNEENIYCHLGGFIDDCRGGVNAESINIDKDTPPFVKSSDASEWYNASSNKSYVFSGDEAKSFNLILKMRAQKQTHS